MDTSCFDGSFITGADFKVLITSSFITRPPLPVPTTEPSIKFSSAISFFADGAFSTSFLEAVGTDTSLTGAEDATSLPITANCPPAFTMLPAIAKISLKTPATGAGTSTLTLSVSSSQSISSCITISPNFLYQMETVASLTLSPKVGTITGLEAGAAAAA